MTCLLAGCSGTGAPGASASPAGSQSVGEACAIVAASVQDAATQLQSLDVTDPQAAVATMSQVSDRLSEAADGVENTDVANLLPGLRSGFAKAAEILQAAADGDLAQLPALQRTASGIEASFDEFSDLCGPR